MIFTFHRGTRAIPLAAAGRLTCIVCVLCAFTPAASLRAQSAAGAQPTPPAALSLGDAIRFAARNSAASQGARLRTDEATARVRQSKAALFPSLFATGMDGRRTFNTASFGIDFPSPPGQPPLFNPSGQVIGPVRNIDFRGHLSAPLFDFSAIGKVRSAQALARSSSADARAVAEQAGSTAALAYVRALRADADVQARNADSVLVADLLTVARNQLQAGVGVALDVTRAEAQLAETHAQLIASRNSRDRARLDLARALGLPARTEFTLTDSLGALAAAPVNVNEDTAVANALRNRPDLRAEEARLAAARSNISAIRSERLPTLGFAADDGVNGKDYSHLLPTYTYGIELSVPIFDGFRREGRVQEAQAQVRESQVREKDLREQAAADVRGALLDLASAREQVDAARERLRLGQQEVEQARERFRAGVAGSADVITASLALTGARTLVLDALTNYQSARVALARAQGAVTDLP